jgi:hypothetical protein
MVYAEVMLGKHVN